MQYFLLCVDGGKEEKIPLDQSTGQAVKQLMKGETSGDTNIPYHRALKPAKTRNMAFNRTKGRIERNGRG